MCHGVEGAQTARIIIFFLVGNMPSDREKALQAALAGI